MQSNMTINAQVTYMMAMEVAWQYISEWIWKYHGCFEEGIWWVYGTSESCVVLERLANGGRVRVRIIHGLNISHKELTYLLQKSISYQNKVLHAYS